ncbi:uncharacterized protein LOC135098423 [Scylla paramamosain]|uniref:uncharacterized protein LOC135098423 n=1 Tax=Scylla paramamosain TaxID=85552 RepID=UPI003082EB79
MMRRCSSVVVVVVVVTACFLPCVSTSHHIESEEDDSCSEGDEGCICFYEDTEDDEEREQDAEVRSRRKRFLFFAPDRGLTLPLGSSLTIIVQLEITLRRYPPKNFSFVLRNATSTVMRVTIPLKLNFDEFRVTSPLNTFGTLGLFRGRRRRKRMAAGALLASDIVRPGGERPAMYAAIEEILGSVGLPGRPCLLRNVCEVFQVPLPNHGFFGEVLNMLLSPSRAPSEQRGLLQDYLQAERVGRTTGDCSAYHAACSNSLYTDPELPLEGEYEEYEDDFQEGETCSFPNTRN